MAMTLHAPLSARPPLPPLQPISTSPKSIFSFLDQAMATTSPKEKNDIIKQIILLWKSQKQEIINTWLENSEKEKILQKFKERYETQVKDYDKLMIETEFYRVPDIIFENKNVDDIIADIKEYEELRSKYQKVSFPEKIDLILESENTDSDKFFLLLDLLFKRMEECVYSYSNRLNKIQESIETELEQKRKNDTRTDAFSQYKLLLEENERLVKMEAEMIDDPFSKRRLSKDITLIALRNLIQTYQKMIDINHRALYKFSRNGFYSYTPQNMVSFDEISNDSNFVSHIKQEYIKEEIEDVNANIEEEKANLSDLRSQILELSNIQFASDGLEKSVKTIDDYNRSIKKISDLQRQIDVRNESANKISLDIQKMNLEIVKERALFDYEMQRYNDLVAEHSKLIEAMNRNKSVMNSLSAINSEVGFSLINGPNDDVARKLSSEIAVLANDEKLKPKVVAPPPEQNPEPKPRRRKTRKTLGTSRSSDKLDKIVESHAQSLGRSDQKEAKRRFLSTKTELLCALSTNVELSGRLYARDKIHKMADSVMTNLKQILSDNLGGFEKDMVYSIGKLNFCSNSILVREKTEAGVQAVDEVADIETMTEDPQPPSSKGKKGRK